MDNSSISVWLDELALYFEKRDTHAEDRAHWANIYNAETARKIKAALTAAEQENARLRQALRRIAEAHHMMIEPGMKAIASAALEGEGE